MKNLSYYQFIERLKQDYNIIDTKEVVLNLPNDNKKIKSFTCSRASDIRIFDGNIEHPYMIGNTRNEKILLSGKELRCETPKSLKELIVEYNLTIQTKPCRICEGNGWTSSGTRYSYKDVFTEI